MRVCTKLNLIKCLRRLFHEKQNVLAEPPFVIFVVPKGRAKQIKTLIAAIFELLDPIGLWLFVDVVRSTLILDGRTKNYNVRCRANGVDEKIRP